MPRTLVALSLSYFLASLAHFNLTIWAEATTGLMLLIVSAILLARRFAAIRERACR